MSVDCSMILRDDSLRKLKTLEERKNRITEVLDFLVKKYGVGNRADEVIFVEDDYGEFPRFNFEPYDVCSVNLYSDYWEIQTAWRYSQYFNEDGGPSGLQSVFFDIAQDFTCDDAYICSEYCTWNGEDLENLTFDEWLERMRSRFGDIREIGADTKYGSKGFPGVFHESFTLIKERMAELSKKVAAKGYTANGIHTIGWYFITVTKDDKVYMMNRDTLELLLPTPIDYFMDLNCSSFEIISEDKVYLFACNGEKMFETTIGHFHWEWAVNKMKGLKNFDAIRVYNEDSGQEVFVINEVLPSEDTNTLCLYKTYFDRNHNAIIPKIHV